MIENNSPQLPSIPAGTKLKDMPSPDLLQQLPNIDYRLRMDVQPESGIRVDYRLAPGGPS